MLYISTKLSLLSEFISPCERKSMIRMIEDIEALSTIWRKILPETMKTWVIFKNGTTIVCSEPDKDPREYALDLMKNWGFVAPGSSPGDFSVTHLDDLPGWVVNWHHQDILNYVSPSEMEDPDSGDMMIGLHGRYMRGEDAKTLDIIHVHEE